MYYIKICDTFQNGGDTHNGGSNYPLRGGKGTMWEGGTRSPAFVHGPNILKQSGVISHKYVIPKCISSI